MGTEMRALTIDELPQLQALAPEFLQEFHGWRTRIEPEHLLNNLQRLYTASWGVAFGVWREGVVVGGIVGMVAPDVFDAELTVCEIAWFLRPADRSGRIGLQLLMKLERWGLENGATRSTFRKILHPEEPVEVPDYRALGYRPRFIEFGKVLQKKEALCPAD